MAKLQISMPHRRRPTGNTSRKVCPESGAAVRYPLLLGAFIAAGFGPHPAYALELWPNGCCNFQQLFNASQTTAARPVGYDHEQHSTPTGKAGATPPEMDRAWRFAQQSSEFLVENVSGAAGQPVRLQIRVPAELLESNADSGGPVFLKFDGLPLEMTLSAGFRLKEAWVVSVRDTSNLALIPPPNYKGAFQLKVTLHRGQAANPEARVINIDLGMAEKPSITENQINLALPTAQGEATQPAHEPSVSNRKIVPPASTLPKPAPPALNKAEEAALLQRAEGILKNGDFESARLIYADLAARGSSSAAFRMAQTFDPAFLQTFFVIGLKPDLGKAKQWYTKAAELGSRDAAERLGVLARQE